MALLAIPAYAAGGARGQAAGAAGTGATLLLPNANERRAVRGRPAPEPPVSNEQVIIRRFEEGLPAELPPVSPHALAPGGASPDLDGDWEGSGDDSESGAESTRTPAAATGLGASYLAFFARDAGGKTVAAAWLDRVASWRAACERQLGSAGVPTQALLGAVAASGFDVEAKGKNGEAGPWLLSREAARAQGLKVGFWLDERRDPVRATEAAGSALKPLLARFGWPLGLVASTFGPAVVEEASARSRAAKSANDPTAIEAQLPRSARLYLARVAALTELLRHKESRTEAKTEGQGNDDPFVTIDPPLAMTLETVAQLTGVDVLTLRTLNPALLRDRTAPFAGVSLRVPVGTAPVTTAAFTAAQGPADRVRIESLRLGESAEALALAQKVLPAEMKRLHGVRDLSELRGPVEVLLPLASEPSATAGGAAPASAEAAAGDELPLVAVPARHFDLPDRARRFYFVAEGDSIDEIAAAAEVTSAEILAWNNLDPGARLQPKMVLQLYVRPDLDRARIALVEENAVRALELGSEEFHTREAAGRGKTRVVYDAHAGDTLPKIARRFGLGAPDLARINRISWASDLTAGQRIVVYAPSAGAARGGRDGGGSNRAGRPASGRPSRPGLATLAAKKPAAAKVPPGRLAPRR
jgi:membrane-bound lytic murein transglycosylase D